MNDSEALRTIIDGINALYYDPYKDVRDSVDSDDTEDTDKGYTYSKSHVVSLEDAQEGDRVFVLKAKDSEITVGPFTFVSLHKHAVVTLLESASDTYPIVFDVDDVSHVMSDN